MRQENPPLCGRDHLWYRSSFAPVKVSYQKLSKCEREIYFLISMFLFSLHRYVFYEPC